MSLLTVSLTSYLVHSSAYHEACRFPSVQWDPERKELDFFNQSAVLHTAYHEVQVCVHREFLPCPRRRSAAIPLPSLEICTNAARAIVNIVEAQQRRTGTFSGPTPTHNTLFTSCVILLINVWGPNTSDQARGGYLTDISRIFEILKHQEPM